MARDYRPIAHLDTYDPSMVDDTVQDGHDIDARLAAEEALDQRDRDRNIRRARVPQALLASEGVRPHESTLTP